MEVWIRSQDKEKLVKCNDIAIKTDSKDGKTIRGYIIVGYFDKETEYEELGFYTSKDTALQILDKIQENITAMYLLTPATPRGLEHLDAGKRYFEKLNGIKLITHDENFNITPIQHDVVVYNMPQNGAKNAEETF